MMKITKAAYVSSSTSAAGKPTPARREFAFIGRSNVGKSSLINSLTGNSSLAHTSSTPGKTQCINHFIINDSWYLVDLPGYGYAKLPDRMRRELVETIRDYIHNSEEMAVLFVLVDSRHDIPAIDVDFLSELGENGIPCAIIFTKTDKQGPVALQRQIEKDCEILSGTWSELPPMFRTSSASGAGRDELLDYIDSILKSIK